MNNQSIYLNLPQFRIDLENMKQTNLWNNYDRDICSEVHSVSLDSSNFIMIKGSTKKIMTLID